MTPDKQANLKEKDNVFFKIKTYLGNKNCTIDTGVKSDQIGKKFIEIFDQERD